MKPVNEDKLVKLGQEFESSEWFPVAMHVGSESKSLPSLTHIYGCRIAPIPGCSERWCPAGAIHGPDKGNPASSASGTMNENDKEQRRGA